MSERCPFQTLTSVSVTGMARPCQKRQRSMFISQHASTQRQHEAESGAGTHLTVFAALLKERRRPGLIFRARAGSIVENPEVEARAPIPTSTARLEEPASFVDVPVHAATFQQSLCEAGASLRIPAVAGELVIGDGFGRIFGPADPALHHRRQQFAATAVACATALLENDQGLPVVPGGFFSERRRGCRFGASLENRRRATLQELRRATEVPQDRLAGSAERRKVAARAFESPAATVTVSARPLSRLSTPARKHGQPAQCGSSGCEASHRGSLGRCRPIWTCHKGDRFTGNWCRSFSQGVIEHQCHRSVAGKGILAAKVHVKTLAGARPNCIDRRRRDGHHRSTVREHAQPARIERRILKARVPDLKSQIEREETISRPAGIRSPAAALADQGYNHASDDDRTVDMSEGFGHTTQPDAEGDAQQNRPNLHGICPRR